ncbi:glyoxylate/hydroxypyruvate reductase A [Lutimaribacter sp. EGI FJ00015]|uniref:Glyoxylate/hydroxypyruvate reductase A n=1 Tax=Lutimaribacter degradans TaxID=2945989 RepID=A0ACC5ZYX3_9RHOB|nr:glyoxylate/hydroxypyruvate reductase A [Lutimaribacter sp. EGI FJ00013]MCM2563531.1 glyoxylate/hydroxypyruvate reductase A [Lutimaribacter sp. EGI FJ00013]MCO0614711.1 glyoxylate/hydroxypyruvate reductase A [Lutimaribacter sp. EGI FJ00015]MCO0637381.1 glyoxylate/hydroxypyruvate reductase A [Lutimaribacter sp. EGI FJ00014]
MTVNVLFAARAEKWEDYEDPLNAALEAAGIEADLRTEFSPEVVDYIVYAPNSDVQDFTPYTRCKAVLNLWAGVENVVGNDTLTQPLCRMVDDEGLTQGMVEWVVGHTLRMHLGMDLHIHGQDGKWRSYSPPVAQERPVTILGLGALGRACGQALAGLGFPVTGWSRTQKQIDGIRCLSGDAGLAEALQGAQIVVLLLPHTPETENILNGETLAMLPRGAMILNPGRGTLIDDSALLAALEEGHIGHAVLDTFRKEPLPVMHPYWAHEKVTVTPHIASTTRPDTAARVIAENIRRGEAGEPFLHVVDRDAGY